MGKTRTFVALEANDQLHRRTAGLIDRLRPHAPEARWIEAEDMHLTLMFLGDLTDAEVAETCSRAEWSARANEPFTLRVSGVGAFPAPERPRAIWLGVTDGSDEVRRLHSDLDDALADFVQRGENRGFVPHWTLARVGRRTGPASSRLPEVLAGLADHDAGELRIDELVVYASELRPEGPEYYVLARCPLGMGKG